MSYKGEISTFIPGLKFTVYETLYKRKSGKLSWEEAEYMLWRGYKIKRTAWRRKDARLCIVNNHIAYFERSANGKSWIIVPVKDADVEDYTINNCNDWEVVE